jgi:2-polyprenyl-3-methyl-5-hydroxy-6-metoxy-1,4-benzoquinol methylase
MTDTLAGYDDIPYESFPIAETHPDRLAVIGRLFGLQPPSPAQARILELGCAAGGNLIPMAWNLPGTRCLGLELSRRQAEQGAQRIRELGIGNIEIRHQDILDLPLDGEPFDYIVAHGVFSWVPENVQEHMLALCGARLAPGGVAYISYNTLPGSRQRAMLRDMLLHHVREFAAPRQRLAAARELLEFLATPLEHAPPGHDWLQGELQYLSKARDSYLYHEYLEERNEALLFADFASRAAGHGLQYLAESQLHTLFTSTLGPQAESALSRFEDLLNEEQYSDFLRLRPFRQTLLCRADDSLTREIDLDAVFALPLYTHLFPDPEQQNHFRNPQGQTFHVTTPLAAGFVAALSEIFPAAGTLGDLLPEAARLAGVSDPPERAAIGRLKEELFALFVSGGLQPTLCSRDAPRRTAQTPGTEPAASDLARVLAAHEESLLPTPRHQTLMLDALSLRMLRLLDGHQDPAAIVRSVESAAAKDPSLARALGVGAPERQRRRIEALLEQLLALLDRHGLLEKPRNL